MIPAIIVLDIIPEFRSDIFPSDTTPFSQVDPLTPAVAYKEDYTCQLQFIQFHQNDSKFSNEKLLKKKTLMMFCTNWEARWKMITVDDKDISTKTKQHLYL